MLSNAASVTVSARLDARAPSFTEMCDLFRHAVTQLFGPDTAARTIVKWNHTLVGYELGRLPDTGMNLSVMSADLLMLDPQKLADAMLEWATAWSTKAASGRGRSEWSYMDQSPARFKEKTPSLIQIVVTINGHVSLITYEEWKL